MLSGLGLRSSLSVAALLYAGTAFAQSAMSTLKGELSAGDKQTNNVFIELYDPTKGAVLQRTTCTAGGRFEFDPVEAGQYQLRVSDPYGTVLEQQFVELQGRGNYVTVPMPEIKKERPVSGTVSVATLERKIPKKAFKEFVKAEKLKEKGDLQASIEHLQKAIELYPQYMEAYNNLGSRYIALKDFEKAMQMFEKADKVGPPNGLVLCNLSQMYFRSRRFSDAEQAARRAIQTDHNQVKAHFVLGLSLYAQNKSAEEAIQELQHVSRQFPEARLYAADLLARQGDKVNAAAELKEYLQAGDVPNRKNAEAMLASLK